MNDRFIAFKILNKIERDKAYSNIAVDTVLKENEAVSAPFVCSLVYGVIERKITLDYILEEFLSQPIKKLNPQVLTILRMGVYQIKYMGKVPVSAAVNESVKLVKKVKCSYSSGLVNSVLRKVSLTDIEMPNTEDKIYDLSITYSCPYQLTKRFINDYGYDNTVELLSSSVGAVPLVIRVNSLRISAEKLIELLAYENVVAEQSDIIVNALIIKSGAIFETSAYKQGLFHVQDFASQICIQNLDPQPDEIIFDVCSAPGGKAFTIAERMNNKGKIYAFDLYEQRVNLISKNAEKLGIKIIDAKVNDSSVFNEDLPQADRILCDVPCSGLGVIRRKPEIKYKDLGFIDKLCDLQYNILNCSAKYLKNQGILIYSTCSLNKVENQAICDRFLEENKEFKKISLSDEDGYMTLMPHKNGTDGFFLAKFIKD